MSTQPPNAPPPGIPPYGPPPGVDPRDWRRQQKDYWRAQKDQNRAYWQANRDQWRVQQQQWRAYYGGVPRRRSVLVPVVLILIGIVALLVFSGRVEPYRFWEWYGHWWPLLLIALGVLLAGEWFLDRDNPYGRSHGGLGFIIFLLVVLGAGATGSRHFNFGDMDFGDHNDDSRFFRGPEHDFDGVTAASIPAGNSVVIQSSVRGDISVQAGTGSDMQIALHKRIFRGSASDAQNKADSFKPVVTTSGTVTTIALNGDDTEDGALALTLPANSPVQIRNMRGDISVTGMRAAVSSDSQHGDTRVRDIQGPVTLHASGGDLMLDQVSGAVEMRGRWDDVTLSNVTASILMDGDYNGDISVRESGPLHFHSPRTDFTTGRIDGQFTMDGEDLHASSVAGPLKLSTHGKEIELTNVSGDITISNADGSVDLTAANPLGSVQIQNRSGGIRLTLPASAGFKLDADARNGEVMTDFSLPKTSSSDDRNVVQGSVGNGALTISLSTEHGDINVHRADSAMTIPAEPPAPPAVPNQPPDRLTMEPRTPREPKAPRTPRAPAVPVVPAAPASPIVSQ